PNSEQIFHNFAFKERLVYYIETSKQPQAATAAKKLELISPAFDYWTFDCKHAKKLAEQGRSYNVAQYRNYFSLTYGDDFGGCATERHLNSGQNKRYTVVCCIFSMHLQPD